MNVIRFECRKYAIPTLIWAFSLAFFAALCIQLFISFTKDMAVFDLMLRAYSADMLAALGAKMSTIRTLPGFYGFCFMYILAAGAFQATYLGMHVVGKEFSQKSAEFIFTKPIGRFQLLLYKLISIVLCLVLVNAIYHGITLWSAYMTQIHVDSHMLLMINGALFLIQLLFMSLGFFIACVLRKIKSALTLTTGIISAFFLLQMIVNLAPEGVLSYFSFLNYLSADKVIACGGYDTLRLTLVFLWIAIFLIGGFISFKRRDIQAL